MKIHSFPRLVLFQLFQGVSLILSLAAQSQTGLPQQYPELTTHLQKAFADIESIELLYSAETTFSERFKELDPNVESIKSTHEYKQKGETWSYAVSKTRNTGVVTQLLFHSDGKIYRQKIIHTGALTIADNPSMMTVARWFNPLFEGFSFMFEKSSYFPERLPKYNQVDSLSPLICDLQNPGIFNVKNPNFKIEDISKRPDGAIKYKVSTSVTENKSLLSSYEIHFLNNDSLLPDKYEKQDQAGHLVLRSEASNYQKYGDITLPSVINTERFIDGKIDSSTVVRIEKVLINSPKTFVDEIDPSTASSIDDQINKITVNPAQFK